MASDPNFSNPTKRKKNISSSQPLILCKLPKISADDDDFQDPSPSLSVISSRSTLKQSPFKPLNSSDLRLPKKVKNKEQKINPGKENIWVASNPSGPSFFREDDKIINEFELDLGDSGGLDSIVSTIDCEANGKLKNNEERNESGLEESGKGQWGGNEYKEESEGGTAHLDLLLKLCDADSDEDVTCSEKVSNCNDDGLDFREACGLGEEEVDERLICCPLCGNDISKLSDELRQVHTNECLDKDETANEAVPPHDSTAYHCLGQVLDGSPRQSPRKVVDAFPVLEWLRNQGLAKYEEIFVREEIDWDTLKWLTEEDLCSIGVTALGPRKKLIHALAELKKDEGNPVETPDIQNVVADETNKLATNKLITDYFPGSVARRKRDCSSTKEQKETLKSHPSSASRSQQKKNRINDVKHKTVPTWCCIPGTPFRVDAFKYLRRECSHWFLTHFHMDHYQGLTRSFCQGKIYCSSITAKLVNMKLGISWDKLQVLPLNQKINIAGIAVTCFDANHCPGAIIILFEPPNNKAVLHTGDFRFSEEMAKIPILQTCPIHTLILDTTYCDPQYDFPKQEAVIQFVIEAIQAEAFNPKTLFLIGSYTIGKERLFLEVARVLRKKVYVSAAKLRVLECLEFPKEDAQWFTLNEHESHIHVVPMWTLASFKRLKCIANQYAGRFNLIVAFSPTGWTFSKGKKKSPGRRWQQGTIIKYEVPYSEHCSFSELRDFVKFISPANIIPSVNNHGPESTSTMVSHLLA